MPVLEDLIESLSFQVPSYPSVKSLDLGRTPLHLNVLWVLWGDPRDSPEEVLIETVKRRRHFCFGFNNRKKNTYVCIFYIYVYI